MKPLEFAEKLQLTPLCTQDQNISVEGVYIGDLLSIVMSKAKKDYAWITIQTHINIVAVAELLELACIIVVENMDVDNDTLEKAKELNIPLFKSRESAYQVACRMMELGIK
jgi:hypothetical protein